MRAVILAGGRGTRLAPYTLILPKPLMPLGDKPILDLITRQLQRHGITDITLAVGYLAELLMSYFGNGQRFGVQMAYSREEEPLGTAGPLSLIPDLTERFLVMNGDVLTTLDFGAMLARHVTSGALCTVAVHRRQIGIDLGVVEYDAEFQLTSYIEKPIHHYQASMGIYIFEPRVLDFIPANQHLDLPDLMQQLMRAGERVHCYPFEGYWLDIGRPDDHAQAVADLDKLEPLLFPPA
ncbi:MAG: sugar phosphate nucleotidyltransferase [Pseudomonadota bacterium]